MPPLPARPARRVTPISLHCLRRLSSPYALRVRVFAHMSGAAEQLDQILRDLEDMPVMAEDGGSADLLESRLLQASRTVDVKA
ncbi:hypothetical protein B0H14DRAFT_3514325 [Mycena olivaceomarginata]|nr:hypothetical protein B0H14DRAFT_3514325 [Mycena olivaceomarginata]